MTLRAKDISSRVDHSACGGRAGAPPFNRDGDAAAGAAGAAAAAAECSR